MRMLVPAMQSFKEPEAMVTEEEGAAGNKRQDPMDILGRDLVQMIFLSLEASSLAHCMWVNRAWRGLAKDDSLWRHRCAELWEGRVSVLESVLDERLMPRRQAYCMSLLDARRNLIRVSDLCKFQWEFRFRWQQLARLSHLGMEDSSEELSPALCFFHPDFCLTQDSKARSRHPILEHEYRWQIVREARSDGSLARTLVKINHWPALEVRRTKQWGWELENKWVRYTARKMPLGGMEDSRKPSL